MSAPDRATAFVLGWARTYTRGIDGHARARRLEELASDCFEQRRCGDEVGASPAAVATSVVARTLAGMPADLLWRQGQLAASRDRSLSPGGRPMGRWLKDNWWVALAVPVGAMTVALGLTTAFDDGTTGEFAAGAMITALGLTMLSGVWLRRTRRVRGDVMIAVGTLPLFAVLWAIVLPVVGLLVLIPAVLDAADASAAGARAPGDERRTIGRATATLVGLVTAATFASLVIGRPEVAFSLVSPVLSILVAHLALHRARSTTLSRLGLTAFVAGLNHMVLLAVVGILGDDGIVALTDGPAAVATAVMAVAGAGGVVVFAIASVTSRGKARPA
jgi:hypothetical protein